MLTRLILFSMLTELAEAMEEAGVQKRWVYDWCCRNVTAIMVPVPQAQDVRVMENALRQQVRTALEQLKVVYGG
jgi:hypothetical protein